MFFNIDLAAGEHLVVVNNTIYGHFNNVYVIYLVLLFFNVTERNHFTILVINVKISRKISIDNKETASKPHILRSFYFKLYFIDRS